MTITCKSSSSNETFTVVDNYNCQAGPILILERKGNPSMNFLMVIMASGIARERVRTTTTTTKSRKMATIIQIIYRFRPA